MTTDISLWFLAAYIAVFLVAAFKAGELQWLWGSIALWAGFGIIGARLLPGVWGITHLSTLYMPHLYITLASLFFFVLRWKKQPGRAGRYVAESGGFISLFAVSGALMTLVFAALLAMVWYRFPTGITPYVLPALLQMYAFKPVYWICTQAVLMLIFYLHRSRIMREPANHFSGKQLQSGILLALLFQTAYVITALLEIRY